MYGSQRCYGEFVELTVVDIWQITDAGRCIILLATRNFGDLGTFSI